MSSSRFPGKVLLPLDGVPMIVYMVRRVRKARLLDDVVVLTSTDASDDALATALIEAGIAVFRGHLENVLLRYADATQDFDPKEIVRLTGDCPLIDPDVIDAKRCHPRRNLQGPRTGRQSILRNRPIDPQGNGSQADGRTGRAKSETA